MLKKLWRLWAKSLGEKVGESDKQADGVAIIRTFWWVTHIVTCFMIIISNGKNLGLWLN
jgi:hypothetical protein